MTDNDRNRPIFNSTTTERITADLIEWLRRQYGLRNTGRTLDWIAHAIIDGRQIDVSEFIAEYTEDKGQVSEPFAAFIALFVGFIAATIAAVVVSVAYIQPVMR